MAAMSLRTLQALFRAPMTRKTMLHVSRAVSGVTRVTGKGWTRHAGVELAALTAALITLSRYATLQDRINTPDEDQG